MIEKQVAIITGASAGIGKATAKAFARRKYTVVLAARRADKLEEVARECRDLGGEANIIVTDVSVEGQVQSLVETTVNDFGRIDVMVNNAGFGLFGRVHETSVPAMRDIFEANYFGLFIGCREVSKVMINQGFGHIFNVSSVLGKRGAPFYGAYCATKFAIAGLTDAMRIELRPYGINVTCVYPGTTDTEFVVKARAPRSGRSKFGRFTGLMPASTVGNKIAATAGKYKPQLIFTTGGKFLNLIATLAPAFTDRLMKIYHDHLAEGLKYRDV